MANELNFDFAGAEAAGISREEILREIEKSGKVNFDFAGARDAGISADDIYSEISKRSTIKPATSQVEIKPYSGSLPEVEASQPAIIQTQVPGTIQSEDSSTTEPSTLMFSEDQQPSTGMTSHMPFEREKRAEQAQKEADELGFSSYVDPETGQSIEMVEGGLQQELPMFIGTRLAMFGGPGMLGPSATRQAFDNLDSAINKGFSSHKAAKLAPQLSTEAKYILNRHPDIEEKELLASLEGVKPEDQAYAISRMLGETGYIRQAVRAEGDTAAGALRADLAQGKNKILETVGIADVGRAKAKYADMLKSIDYDNVHDASGILKDLDFLERFYGTTPSAGNRVVTQMKAVLSEDPKITIHDALALRADLNELLRKATRGREKVKLNKIKENVDGFINKTATPEQKVLIDDAIGTYARTMQNKEVLDLVNKNTKDGIAVNWTKLHRDLSDANLRSPEAVDALRVAEAFSKRFGNDKKLLTMAMPKGSSPDSGGVLGAWGYLINQVKDTLAIYGNRAQNLKIQKAILKSLKRGRTNLDFIENIKNSPDIPEEAKEQLLLTFRPVGQAYDKTTNSFTPPAASVVDDIAKPAVDNATKQVADDKILTLEESRVLAKRADDIDRKGVYEDLSKEEIDEMNSIYTRLDAFRKADEITIPEEVRVPIEGTSITKPAKEKLDEIKRLDKEYRNSGGPIKPPMRTAIDNIFEHNVENKIDSSISYSRYEDAIMDYTGEGYATINKALRQGGKDKHKIIKFLEEAPENFEGGVYRGAVLSEAQHKALSKLTNGDVLSNLSPLSTSTNRDMAAQFVTGDAIGNKKPTMLTILGKGHDLGHRSNSGEEEVLMRPGKFFKIVDKFETDAQVHISLKEITEAEAKGSKIDKSLLAIPAAVGLSQVKQDNPE